MKTETRGLLLGLLAVAAFSLTLPATRAALVSFEPVFVCAARIVLAAGLAAAYLAIGRHRLPNRSELKALCAVVAGVVFGFPLFTALAMQHVDASHGGVVLGIMPLTVAATGALVFKERPSPSFWLFAVLGSAVVVAFSLLRSHGGIEPADIYLLIAVVTASVSYAVGATVSRSLGGLQTISWALLMGLPIWIPTVILTFPATLAATPGAWIGLLYVALISQFLGFLPWFRGLALGGIARVGQTQLLQPFLTIIASALLLGEAVDAMTIGFAVAVFAIVAAGRHFGTLRRGT